MPEPERRADRVLEREPRWREGIRLFHAGKFFESHEAWEALWRDVAGAQRLLLQGLIQVAAAYHHLRRGNRRGARYLAGRARLHLARWLPSSHGLAIGRVLDQLDQELARGRHAPLGVAAPRLD